MAISGLRQLAGAHGRDGMDQLGPDSRRRLLAWGILHRCSNLSWWMQRLPAPPQPTLDALADCWFATE
jgi:hygromycin-B 7''-O-kinase